MPKSNRARSTSDAAPLLSQGVALLVGHERARLCRTTLSTPIGENSRLHGTTQEFSDDED